MKRFYDDELSSKVKFNLNISFNFFRQKEHFHDIRFTKTHKSFIFVRLKCIIFLYLNR